MADLLIRVGSNDAALLRRVYGIGGGPRAARTPQRIVVDAHVPSREPDIAATARRAGVPLLVDPQTYYLQDAQHHSDPWSRLPFAAPQPCIPPDFMSTAQQDRLVAECIDYQLTAGATTIIAPYVHIERPNSGWIAVQAGLWRRTRHYLDQNQQYGTVIAVLAIGWRLLHPTLGLPAISPALAALDNLSPTEVAVAASKVHTGARPEDRLAELLTLVRRLSHRYPVLMWQQGLLGEACVVAGATGYETGIGHRERCDLNTTMATHRKPPTGHPAARPVYIPALKRSIPARSIKELHHHAKLWNRLICTDPQCCPPAGVGLLADARQHAIVSRARALDTLTQPQTPQWRWHQLAADASTGLDLAARINRLAERNQGLAKIDTGVLRSVSTIAENRRQHRPLRHRESTEHSHVRPGVVSLQ